MFLTFELKYYFIFKVKTFVLRAVGWHNLPNAVGKMSLFSFTKAALICIGIKNVGEIDF